MVFKRHFQQVNLELNSWLHQWQVVVRLEWVLQLLNTSGLTWVAVLLPRSKIPKLKSESVSRRPWYGGIYSRLCNESSPRHGEAVNEPGMRVCRLTPCRVGRDQRLESFSTWDSSPRSKETLSLNSWNSLSTPSLSIELRGDSRDHKRAGDLYSDRGITDEMRCLRCLGSGQQFTGALAAKGEG